MGQSAFKNPRKIFSQASTETVLNNRVTTLENNEYKITYYEIVSGTSGSLTIPTNSTINSNEFGLSGNAILSKIDGSNKPTYESPKTVGGVVVTATLNPTTGAWTSSDTYTDATVALIYSIKIKSIYYSNLNYDKIIETVDLAVTKTSDLINDGDDGVSHFISLNDLPSNLILYPTTTASDVVGYFKLVSSITDPSYNAVAVDVSTGDITTTNQLISSLVTSTNIIIGNPGVFNITTIGNITRTSGSGQAEFYFEIYKRDSAGTETLITTSDNTLPVLNTGYSEFSATALWNDGIFVSTDRIVLKFYASRVSGGSDPNYNFQFGGTAPVRTLVPIPLTVVPALESAKVIFKDFTNSSPLTGTTAITLLKSALIPANTVTIDDEINIFFRALRSTAGGTATHYFYVNTTASLTGATLLATHSGAASYFGTSRNLFVKSATVTETIAASFNSGNDNSTASIATISSLNIDWTANVYIIQAFQNAAGGDSTTSRGITIKRFR
jgi:hypothetical protein